MYTEKILGIREYYKYMKDRLGANWMLSLSDSNYPQILARGWCDHRRKEIVVCKTGNWKLRLWHERGHSVGLKHTNEHGHVMHPWGIFRGMKGIDEILKRLE